MFLQAMEVAAGATCGIVLAVCAMGAVLAVIGVAVDAIERKKID